MNVTTQDVYEKETCPSCGVIFFIPSALQISLKEHKRTFYCPNGHGQNYRRSPSDELRDELEKVKKDRAKWISTAQDADLRAVTAEEKLEELMKKNNKTRKGAK